MCELTVFLHKEVLVAKIAQNEVKEVLSEVIELVNFIKTCTVKSRIFELICKDMDSLRSFAVAHWSKMTVKRESAISCS